MKKIIITLLLMSAVIPVRSSFVSENGKLSVDGLQLVNECGNPIQLRGVSSHGLQWFGDCYNDDNALDFAVDYMGANLFRIAMYVEEGGYLTNPDYYSGFVNDLVDEMEQRGIYCIIDWHLIGNPLDYESQAIAFWDEMSSLHAGKDHVIYEICNEPDNTVDWAGVKLYAESVIPVIRENDPDTVIIIGTPNWSQLGSDVVANPITITSDIMYACHFYAASEWHDTTMITNYVDDIPIFASEWGAVDSTGDGDLDTVSAQAFIDVMRGENSAGVTISWASWSFSDDFRSSSMLETGTCGGSVWDGTILTDSGNFVMEKIAETPDNVDPCWSPTPTYTITLTSTNTPVLTPTPTNTITKTHTVSPTFTISRTHTVSPTASPTSTISKTHTISPTHTVSPTFTITPTFAPKRINCGSYFGYTDTAGNYWVPDEGYTGGSMSTKSGEISGTQDDDLYLSERWGEFTYNIDTPPGLYILTLKFAEVYWENPGERVFSVTAEGNEILSGFDIVEEAGSSFAAVDKSFEIEVSDSSLDLDFTYSVDAAKISAIEILEAVPTPTLTPTPPYNNDYEDAYVYPSLLDMTKGNEKICFRSLTDFTELSIYNITGELVYRNEKKTPDGELCLDFQNMRRKRKPAPGLYIYVLQSGTLVKKGKFVIIR